MMRSKEMNSKSKNQSRMKQGYYQIHVLLEQSSSLCLNKNEDVDAMITVQAFGQIQYSKVLKKVGYESKLWGEHFYFSKTFNLDQLEALQRSVVIIKAWDHRKLLKDALIGQHELSISRIYQKQGHLITHTWLALSNITKNFGEVSGMVKLSVNVIGQNDRAQVLQLQPYNASNKDKNILLASGIQRQGHQLTVDIYEGRDLKPVAGQTTDAYIGVQFGMIYSRTETVVNSCDPKWNQVVQIPVHYSDKIASVQHIVLRLIDANVFKSKQVMGSCYIPVNQLIQEKKQRSFYIKKTKKTQRYDQKIWVNFYGPQIDCQNNQFKHKYSIYPEIAPYYTGSVFLKVVLQENSNPRKDHRPREVTEKSDKGKEEVVQPIKPKKMFTANVRFQMGMNLPIKFSSYQLSVRIGNFEVKSRMKKVKHGFVLWNDQRELDLAFYENQQFPDVFFYLINEDEDRICFCREKIILKQKQGGYLYGTGNDTSTQEKEGNKKQKHYKGEIADKWRKLKPDLTKISIYNEEAGYVKLKLEVESTPDNKHKNNNNKIKQKVQHQRSFSENTEYYSEKVMSIPCKIVVDLYCAQNLLAGDDDGSADPYFKFSFQESVKVSSVKSSTINPVYIERMILDGYMGKQNLIMPLTVTVFNKNPLNDQAIGTCYIDLQEGYIEKRIQSNTNYNNIPQWYDIYIDGNKYGKFLAGITIINKKIKILEQIEFFEQELQIFNINLVALGLRSLKSSNNLISIKKPIINFDIESLRCYERKQKKRNDIIDHIKIEKVQKSEKDENKIAVKKQQTKNQSYNLIITAPTAGASVNLNRLQTIDIKLPRTKAFWPKLCARVTNSVLGNIYEPHIGYFYIDLRKAYEHTQRLRDEFNAKKNKTQKIFTKSQRALKLQQIDKTVIKNLKLFIVKSIKYNWHEVCRDTPSKLNKLQGAKEIKQLDQNYIVIMPSYSRQDSKEVVFRENHKQVFEENREYIKIGYDNKNTLQTKTKDQRNRHYRYCLNTTYENYFKQVRKTNLGIFQETPIKQGRVFLPQQKSVLTSFVPQQRQVGFFKGNCILVQKESLNEQSQFVQKHRQLFKDYIKQEKFRMYLYILNASSLPSKQAGEPPQPILVVKLGENQQIKFPQKQLQKSSDPEFNVLVKKDLVFPQNSEITIQVWDKGIFNTQELIGETVLYAQNRVYIQFGKMKFNNPAETHPLKVMQSRQQQGKIRFWVDFVPLDSVNLYREFEISSSASPQYEVRVIVWNCSDILQDEQDFTGMFDLYIACCFNNQIKETDVHYRTQNGDGSYNWRMLFPVKLPITDTTLVFKIYDKSLVKGDEFKASGQLDIREYLQQAYENEIGVKLFLGQTDMYSQARLPCQKKADKSGTVIKYSIFPVRMKNRKSQQSNIQVEGGKVYISVQILPKALAQKKPAGEGRGNPNEHPNLPQPTGRFQFSMNPMTMFTRLFGKKFRSKICTLILCFIFLTGFTYFVPSLAGSILAASI